MPMTRATTLLTVVFVLSWGCATTPPAPVSHGDLGAVKDSLPALSADSDGVVEDAPLGAYRSGVDSAAALYDFGEVPEFLSARDSLRGSIETILRNNPKIRYEPEFAQLLKALDALDSLQILRAFSSHNLRETDSLALATEAWPDIDTTRTEVVGLYAESNDTIFPVILNDRVDFWIRYFSGRGKERFERSLYRMELYRPTIESILAEMNLPTELICVALIESGFNLKARSRARAVGPWQFISGTGRIYGLRVNWWYDERRDIVASTYAAGNYLKDLYGIWQSWPLALASYNCGEYRVARAIAVQKTRDFWDLKLPKQTERYVPKFLAALYILRDPAKHGFVIPDVEPIKFDKVTISDATDLKLIARSAGSTVDVLSRLNPSILRWATPPKMEIEIKVPVGTAEDCLAKLTEIPPAERITWRKHRIRKGETLSVIASKYGTSISALKSLNRIRNAHRIREGRHLIVPMQGDFSEVASSKPRYKTKRRNLDKETFEKYAKRFEPPANHKRVIHIVKKGDTLGDIAETFHTRASKLRRWNNLSFRSYIYAGQRIVVYVPESFDLSTAPAATQVKPNEDDFVRRSYVVKKGDTVYSISQRFKVGISDLLVWNNKKSSRIYPGQKLEIWTPVEK